METFFHDMRYGVRMLLKNPGSAVVAIIALALGIGANTAIFSVVNAVLLKSLPYPDPDRLVVIYEFEPKHGTFSVAWPNFADWRAQTPAFESMAAYTQVHFDLSGVRQPTLLRAGRVSASFFTMLG